MDIIVGTKTKKQALRKLGKPYLCYFSILAFTFQGLG